MKKALRDRSTLPGFEILRGLSPAQQRKIIERALRHSEGKKPLRDLSKLEGFAPLKDLTPSEQRKVIERALRAK